MRLPHSRLRRYCRRSRETCTCPEEGSYRKPVVVCRRSASRCQCPRVCNEKNPLGDGKAQSRIVELQVPLGGQCQWAARPAIYLASLDDVIDENRRRNSIPRTSELRRINPHNPFGSRKPKYAGRRLDK